MNEGPESDPLLVFIVEAAKQISNYSRKGKGKQTYSYTR